MLDFFRPISAPVTMHLEITEACPERCRHCYNFIRDHEYKSRTITKKAIDNILDGFKSVGGFHVILSGGEPLINIDRLLYAVEGVIRRGLSLSINSNLILATPKKMKLLKSAGVTHILTTLFSYDHKIHDYMASRPGAHSEIMRGIEVTRDAGIRVSVNMIVTNINGNHVYKTGKYLKEHGFNKFIANRMIPSSSNSESLKKEFLVGKKLAKRIIYDLLKLQDDYNMIVSTCRALPYCFMGDLERNITFTSRGCNAGKRHMLVTVEGNTHACVHESNNYGNVIKDGFVSVWQNMNKWRRKDILPKKCQACSLIGRCEGGCRQIAEVVNNDWSESDNLCVSENIIKLEENKYFKYEDNKVFHNAIYYVNKDLQFRDENDATLVRIFGAKCILVENEYGKFLKKYIGKEFKFKDFPFKDLNELILYLLYDIVKTNIKDKRFGIFLKQYMQ